MHVEVEIMKHNYMYSSNFTNDMQYSCFEILNVPPESINQLITVNI